MGYLDGDNLMGGINELKYVAGKRIKRTYTEEKLKRVLNNDPISALSLSQHLKAKESFHKRLFSLSVIYRRFQKWPL